MLDAIPDTTVMPDSDPFAAANAPSTVVNAPNPDALSLTQLENMLSDLRFQPVWRLAADTDSDYYDSHQLSADRLQRMDKLGIPPLVTNLIRPAIDAVLGLEAKSRTDWRVIQEDDAAPVPEPVMNALNAKLNEAERETRADRAVSDAHAGQVKAGIGWVEVARSTDAMDYPYRVATVHRSEMWWDMRAKKPDLTDGRYLIRKRRYDMDELIAMMPEHAALVRKACYGGFGTWQNEIRDLSNPVLAYAADVERLSNLDESEWRDGERHRVMMYEVWYRKWTRGKLLRLPNGKVVPFNPMDMRHLAAVQAGVITPFEGTYSEIRVAFYLGPHQLYDFKSPYSHRFYPYVPFFGFREDKNGIPYGLVRSMRSPQDVVNSADAKMHWMLNARRLIATSDAIDLRHNSWQQVQDELSRPDAVVMLDPAKPTATFKVEQDFALTAQQFNRRMQAASDIQNASGIFQSMMGKESSGLSGVAANAMIEQGSVTLAEIRDNYTFSRRQVGEMLFSMVREDLIGQQKTVHVPGVYGSTRKQPVTLNQPRDDGTLENNVALVNARVVLADVPSTPAFRAQQLQVLSEVVKSLPPEMQMATIDVLIKLTDVPDKELLVERLRRMAGIQDIPPEQEDQMMQEQAQQAAAQATLLAEGQQANTDVNVAKAEKLRAETEKLTREADVIELDLRNQIDATAQPGAQGDMTSVHDELQQALEEVQQLRLALQNKMEKITVDAGLKKYQIDQQTAVDRERAGSEHAARAAKVVQDDIRTKHAIKPGKEG